MTERDPVLDDWLAVHTEGLIAIRRNIHAHPELSGAEHATTELVSERLRLAGLATRTLAVGTGLVSDLDPSDTRTDPRRLALRADIDALAMDDMKEVPYRSQVPGVAHACGHDVHTAIMMGTALYFAHHRDQLPGSLRFLFQPAEERVPGGALDVISDGGLDGVSAVMGVHCMPKMDVGTIALREGAITSAADMVEIALSGPGGHTARPEETVDLITVASRLVIDLPIRLQDLAGGAGSVKLVFGAFHAGDAGNVIPSHGVLRASLRTPSSALWERLPELFDQALEEVLADTPAVHRVSYTHGVPPVVNDPGMVEIVRRAGVAQLTEASIRQAEQSWGADDFAWFTREVPAVYIRVGTHNPDNTGPRLDLHAGYFDVDERAIAIGVRIMVAAVHEYFARAMP
ncbi:MAG: amidohydrolase [Acidimicrobiales bacterium]|nr:amidohydrolase [Acidimicrobiales bacterium]